MRLYARDGIADWNRTPFGVKKRARECLGTAIAENEAEAFVTVRTIYQSERQSAQSIPMPKRPKHGIERCFFIPVSENQSGGRNCHGIRTVSAGQRDKCLSYRFEPAHRLPSVTIMLTSR